MARPHLHFQPVIQATEQARAKIHGSESLAHTFDGQHPCCLCKAIAAAKKSEKKNELALELKKMEFLPVQQNLRLIGLSRFSSLPETDHFRRLSASKAAGPAAARILRLIHR
jgi:hypothetical protein